MSDTALNNGPLPARFFAPSRDFLMRELTAQRDRLLLWVPVFLAFGVGGYFSLRTEPPFTLCLTASSVLIMALALLFPARHRNTYVLSLWLVLCALGFVALGFTAAQLRTISLAAPLLETKTGPVDVTGTVAGIDRLDEDQQSRLILENLIIEDLPQDKTPHRVRIKVHQTGDVRIGDRVKILAGLNPPSAPVAPYAFDFQRYAYFRQIGAFGFSYRDPQIIDRQPVSVWAHAAESVRQNVVGIIGTHLDDVQMAIVSALMTGERAAIQEEDWEALRNAGLAHMLAISGLHVGLIAAVIFFITRFFMALSPAFALNHPIKKYAAVAALLGAAAYVILVGATIPSQRALMMTGIVLIGVMLDRVAISLRLVALAASVILLLRPEALMSASFQMSFAAVACLIVFYEHIRQRWSSFYAGAGRFRRCVLYFAGVSLTTVIASLATGLFSIYHFQQFAFLGIVSNLLAVPLLAFVVMPAAVVSFALMPLGLAFLPLKIMGMGVAAILSIAHDVADIPYAALFPAAMPGAAMIMIVLGSVLLMLWNGYGRLMSLGFFMLAAVILHGHKPPDILISSGGKLVAVRHEDGLFYANSRIHDRFALSNWLRLNGQTEDTAPVWDELKTMKCGEWGCHMTLKGKNVAFAQHAGAHREDCHSADILITAEPEKEKRCHAMITIDRYDTWHGGAHALWVEEGRVLSVAAARGVRPWTVNNRR